jgi:hypothetical protein
LDSFPPDTKEKQEQLAAFFQGTGNPAKAAEKIPQILKACEAFNPNIKTWGAVGVRHIFPLLPT